MEDLILLENSNQFQSYDYPKNKKEQIKTIDHQCKMGFVSVLDGDRLSESIGEDVLRELGVD